MRPHNACFVSTLGAAKLVQIKYKHSRFDIFGSKKAFRNVGLCIPVTGVEGSNVGKFHICASCRSPAFGKTVAIIFLCYHLILLVQIHRLA